MEKEEKRGKNKIKKKGREERGKVPGCQGQARPVGPAGAGGGAESQRRDARHKPALPAKKGRLHPNFPAPARPSRPGKAGRDRRGTRRQENKPEGKVKRQAAAGSGDGGEPG